MTEAQRHQILLDMLAQLGFVTVENVIERLGISPATAPRHQQARRKREAKVRSAGRPCNSGPLDADSLHRAQNHDEKVRIAKAASQLVNPVKA